MKLAVLVIGLGAACGALADDGPGAAGKAAEEAPARPEVRVSLQARDLVLRAAMKQLVTGTREVIQVDRDVPDEPIRLTLRDIPLEQAVRLVTRQASRGGTPITYQPTPRGFRILRGEAPPAEPENPLRVTITAREEEPRPVAQPVSSPEPPKEGTEDPGGPAPEIGAQPPVIEGTPEMRGTYFVPDGDIYIIPPFRPIPFRHNVRSFAILTPEDPKKRKPFRVDIVPKRGSIVRPSSGIAGGRGKSIMPGGAKGTRPGGGNKGAGTGGGGIGRRRL